MKIFTLSYFLALLALTITSFLLLTWPFLSSFFDHKQNIMLEMFRSIYWKIVKTQLIYLCGLYIVFFVVIALPFYMFSKKAIKSATLFGLLLGCIISVMHYVSFYFLFNDKSVQIFIMLFTAGCIFGGYYALFHSYLCKRQHQLALQAYHAS